MRNMRLAQTALKEVSIPRTRSVVPRVAVAGPSRLQPLPVIARPFSSCRASRALVQPGPVVTASNRAEITLRRFWKTAYVSEVSDGSFRIKLDHRDLKAPSGKLLVIPRGKRLFATLIAAEWEMQTEAMKPTSLSLTSLAFRAVDGFNDEFSRTKIIEKLMQYLETDTILYHDDGTGAPTLESMQKEHWHPLVSWMSSEYKAELALAEGFLPATQEAEVISRIRKELDKMDHWELAAFERAAYASKSFIIALALCRGRLTADQASDAAHVEVRSQIERWGEVEDSHDVDYQDIRRLLGSCAVALLETP